MAGPKTLVVVTGGTRGLGESLVNYFSSLKADVVQIARGHSPVPKVRSIVCDFSQPQDYSAILLAQIPSAEMRSYDTLVLINNAGLVSPIGPIETLCESEIQRSIMVNLVAPMALTSAFIRLAKGLKWKRFVIVNVSSGVAKRPIGHWAAYSAAKAGLENFSVSLKESFSTLPACYVVNFQPGVMDTEMQGEIRRASETEFPDVDRFKQMKVDGRLTTASLVAEKLGNYICMPNLPAYSDVSIHDLLKA